MVRTAIDRRTSSEQRLKMTYDEYLAWDDREEGNRGEWVDGEVIILLPPKVIHQQVLVFLLRVVADYVDRFGLGHVFVAPTEMLLREQRASRQPDLMIVSHEHSARVTEDRIEGPADLAVELISNDSTIRDQRAEYEAAGVTEYWLLDPRPGQHHATFLQREAAGRYQEMPLDVHGRYHSAVLAPFTLDPTWFWQNPLPNPLHLRTATDDS